MDLKENFLGQIDMVLNLYNELCQKAGPSRYSTAGNHFNFGALDFEEISNFYVAGVAVVGRVAGIESIYGKQVLPFIEDSYVYESVKGVARMAGILKALRADVEAGFLNAARELFHGELFNDFLEMAEFLLREGYKDAAAVIGGGALETHLRQLCIKHLIDTEHEVKGQVQAKRAEQLNDELKSKGVYVKLDHKNVTSWLDLRNKAAHANYSEYTAEQVALLLQGIRYFISRYSA